MYAFTHGHILTFTHIPSIIIQHAYMYLQVDLIVTWPQNRVSSLIPYTDIPYDCQGTASASVYIMSCRVCTLYMYNGFCNSIQNGLCVRCMSRTSVVVRARVWCIIICDVTSVVVRVRVLCIICDSLSCCQRVG